MTAPLANATQSAAVAGREVELDRLVEASMEGELTFVTSADPALAAALADACADTLAQRGWMSVRADARLANDETDLARAIVRSVSALLAGGAEVAQTGAVNEPPDRVRARLGVRRTVGERAYALLTEEEGAPVGVEAVACAADAVVAARAEHEATVLVVVGADELVRPGRSRFAVGADALWALRGVWQLDHGPALLTGGPALAAMTADREHAFYGYGHLHESPALTGRELDGAYRELIGGRVSADAYDTVREVLGDALWMVPDLLARLPVSEPAGSGEVRAAWGGLVRARAPELFALLRAASHVHRFAVPVLKAVSRGERPYATLRRQGLTASDVSRAQLALEAHALIRRVGDGRWTVTDPALAELLRSA